MRSLSVYYTHKPGGFCKRLYRLLSSAATRGNEVHYITLDPPPTSLSSRVKIHLMPFPLKERSGLFFWALFTFLCPFYSLVVAWRVKPERYIVFGAYYSTMLVLARMIQPAPLTLFLRSLVFKIDRITEKPPLIRWIAEMAEKIGMRSATEIVFMTESMQKDVSEFLGRSSDSDKILPNDVPDLDSSLPERNLLLLEKLVPRLKDYLQDHTLLILTSGVIDQRKNIDLLIDTMQELSREFSPSDAFLIVAGDGPLLKSHMARTKTQKIENVGYCGWVDEMMALYRCVDLVVHPSIHEGMPNSVLEPLGLGIPVLASNIPEIQEVLPEDSLRFSPRDPEELTARLRGFLNDSSELSRARTAAQQCAERYRFNWEDRACRLLELDL